MLLYTCTCSYIHVHVVIYMYMLLYTCTCSYIHVHTISSANIPLIPFSYNDIIQFSPLI